MAVERKCPKCSEWNKDNDHCTACGTVISPILKEEIREAKKEEIRKNMPPSKFDIFLDKWKNHSFFLIRGNILYFLFDLACFYGYWRFFHLDFRYNSWINLYFPSR